MYDKWPLAGTLQNGVLKIFKKIILYSKMFSRKFYDILEIPGNCPSRDIKDCQRMMIVIETVSQPGIQ